MVVKFALLVTGGYLFGSVPVAYLVAKLAHGIDLRTYGSGNVGASNLAKVTPKWVSIIVIIYDLGKGMLLVWAAKFVGLSIAQQVVVGTAVVIGHDWPVFIGFRGGRGVLTTVGVAFILPLINGLLVPWGVIIFLAAAGIGLYIIHNMPLGVGTGILALPVASWVAHEPISMTWGYLAMSSICVMRRLALRRADIAATLSWRQILVNRLLFDRDIRNREAWVNRETFKDSSSKKPSGKSA